jgi:hypothetical protein
MKALPTLLLAGSMFFATQLSAVNVIKKANGRKAPDRHIVKLTPLVGDDQRGGSGNAPSPRDSPDKLPWIYLKPEEIRAPIKDEKPVWIRRA